MMLNYIIFKEALRSTHEFYVKMLPKTFTLYIFMYTVCKQYPQIFQWRPWVISLYNKLYNTSFRYIINLNQYIHLSLLFIALSTTIMICPFITFYKYHVAVNNANNNLNNDNVPGASK